MFFVVAFVWSRCGASPFSLVLFVVLRSCGLVGFFIVVETSRVQFVPFSCLPVLVFVSFGLLPFLLISLLYCCFRCLSILAFSCLRFSIRTVCPIRCLLVSPFLSYPCVSFRSLYYFLGSSFACLVRSDVVLSDPLVSVWLLFFCHLFFVLPRRFFVLDVPTICFSFRIALKSFLWPA